jgi:membrane protease subunit HflK
VKRWLASALICLAAYVATGLCFVQPDEQVVVRRFGRMLAAPYEPGPHFGLPWGLDRVDRLKPREVKRVTIGPLNLAGEAVGASLSEFLTGDRNLVLVRATVQYTIKDPAGYLFHATTVDPLVANAGEAAMSELLAGRPVDDVMTQGKREVSIQIRNRLQQLADDYELGVMIRSVDVGSVSPPPEVAEAFDNVISALRERDRMINLARGYADRRRAQSQADAERIENEARAAADRRVRQAQGEVARFEDLLTEYQRSPALTARRLYLETMARTLPRLRAKLIMDSGAEMDLSILREESP